VTYVVIFRLPGSEKIVGPFPSAQAATAYGKKYAAPDVKWNWAILEYPLKVVGD